MCRQKINKVIASGILGVSVILSSSVAYANVDNIKEIVFENFVVTNPFDKELFIDINGNEWFIKGVSSVFELSLMQGESSDRFNPNGNITIAQTIAVASRVHALYETGNLEILNSYTGAKWYSGVEKYALEKGIIKVGDFSAGDMNKPATRAELCYILDGALPEKEVKGSISNGFAISDVKDLNSKVKYVDTVLKHINAGIITGYQDGSIKPNNKVTRAEACVIIDRLVRPSERIKKQKTETSKPTTDSNSTRVVYVTPRSSYGTQNVYDKAGSGLTPIKVKYGRHTYLSNNQEEYDYVIKVVEDMLQFKGKAGQVYKKELEKWNDADTRDWAMGKFERQFGKISEDYAYELYKIESACYSAKMHKGASTENGIDSAYQLLTLGKGDCTADAMINLAVMDAMGYNAKTVANDSKKHEWVMIEVNGEWLHNYGAGFEKLSAHTYNRVTTPDTFNNAK